MLFVVTNKSLCRDDFLQRTEQIAAAQPQRILLREKQLESKELLPLARSCADICKRFGVPFSVNSNITVAKQVDADIHLPYKIFCEKIDELSGFKTRGVSVHSVSEAVNAEKLGADYFIAGHIFQTDCKKGLAPKGLAYLESISNAVKIPVLGIGGITKERIPKTVKAGAKGVCVMSHFMTCDNPYDAVIEFKNALAKENENIACNIP